jgi:hypothetical protein
MARSLTRGYSLTNEYQYLGHVDYILLSQLMYEQKSMSSLAQFSSNAKNTCFLLQLPLETRLEIYCWLFIIHPVRWTQLDIGYPNPSWQPYITEPIEVGHYVVPPSLQTDIVH